MCTEVVSILSPSPPSIVGLVVLKITGQKDKNQDLIDGALDENYSNEANDGVRGVP